MFLSIIPNPQTHTAPTPHFGKFFGAPSGKIHFRKAPPTTSLSFLKNNQPLLYICYRTYKTIAIYPVLLCNYFCNCLFSTRFQSMSSGTKLPAKDATDSNHRQIQRLRDPNPTEDVPDQDSAKNIAKSSFDFILHSSFIKNNRFVFVCVIRKCIFPKGRSKELPKIGLPGWRNLS